MLRPWRIRFAFAILVSALALPAVPPAQAETIRFHSAAWQAYTNADGTGFAWDIVRAVYKPAGVTLDIDTMPYARAVNTVTNGRADAWVGSYADEVSAAVYPDWHYDADRVDAVMTGDTAATWSGSPSLEGARVGWIRGYQMGKYLDVTVDANPVDDRTSALRMVDRGRIAYFLDPAIELDKAFAELPDGLETGDFAREPVMNLKLYVAFAPTTRGRKFARIWDERFPELLADGRIAEIYDKHGFELWPFEQPRQGGGS